MPDQIIPIAKIRAAAEAAASANKPQCPTAFQFVESVWREQYKLAQHELRCKVAA
jgi:hypothetical protein